MSDKFSSIKNIVDRVLGNPKSDYAGSGDWYEYNCPFCAEENLNKVDSKYNFAVQIGPEGLWGHCWSCLHTGNLRSIIKRFGTHDDLTEFKEEVNAIRESGLYQLNSEFFNENSDGILQKEELLLPEGYKPLYGLKEVTNIKIKYDSSTMPNGDALWEFLAQKYVKYSELITDIILELVEKVSNYKPDKNDLGLSNLIPEENSTYKYWLENFQANGSYEWFYNLLGRNKDEIIGETIVKQSIRNYKYLIKKENANLQQPFSDGDEILIPYPYDTFVINSRDKPQQAIDYLNSRGVGMDLIERYKIGYVPLSQTGKYAGRIVIPSYDEFSDLSFWVARDYTGKNKVKMYNPTVDKTKIVFNEEKINWYEPITLVEGPFDHIVVPNSIPLLGKYLNEDHITYKRLVEKSRSEIYIMLDNDAEEKAVKMYCDLLKVFKDRLKIIFMPDGYDPSDYYRDYGKKGIIKLLKSAKTLKESTVNILMMGGDYSMVKE